MSTLEQRLVLLAQSIGTDVKGLNNLIGVLSGLNTTNKTNLVAAINEVKAALATIDLTSIINDGAIAGVADKTYSADKIIALIAQAKADMLGGITDTTLDTIKELADFLKSNSVAGGVVEQLNKRVRVDAGQSFTSAEQIQARGNIGAAAVTDLVLLSNSIGNADHDFVADYNTAKA